MTLYFLVFFLLNIQIDASVKALRGNGGTGYEMRLVGLKGVTAPNNRVLIKMDGLGIPPLMMTELFFSSQASTFVITALEFYISYPPLSDHLRHGLTSTFVVCTGGSRGGAQRAEKKIFLRPPPPYLRVWMTGASLIRSSVSATGMHFSSKRMRCTFSGNMKLRIW